MPHHSSPSTPSRTNTTAAKFITTVRRSFSHSSKKRQPDQTKPHQVDDQNSRIAFTPSQFRFPDLSSSRPTIEQIAMGLHVSRTPHLRPIGRHQRPPRPPSDTSQDGVPPRVHAPPPARSSLKKSDTLTSSSSITPPSTSVVSISSTTITSVTPSLVNPSSPLFPATRSPMSLKTRMMTRFLPGARSFTGPIPSASDPASESSPPPESGRVSPRRKAVRFTTSPVIVGLDERS